MRCMCLFPESIDKVDGHLQAGIQKTCKDDGRRGLFFNLPEDLTLDYLSDGEYCVFNILSGTLFSQNLITLTLCSVQGIMH